MEQQIQELQLRGYSPSAIAMAVGGPVGTVEYYRVLEKLDPQCGSGCPYCGELCFGTGDCNCRED